MHYVLIIIIANGVGVGMQEFNSKETCLRALAIAREANWSGLMECVEK